MRGRKDRSFQRELRTNQTDAEALLWRQLRARRLLGLKFRRQHDIGPYTVDFVCTDERLVIELDGGQHAGREAYDAERTRFLESLGYRVLRFWNHEALAQTDAMLEALVAELGKARPSP